MIREDLTKWVSPRLKKELKRREQLLSTCLTGRLYRSVIVDECFQLRKEILRRVQDKQSDNSQLKSA